MNGPLSSATIIAALVLAVWYLLRAALDRAPSDPDLIAALALSALVVILVVVAVIGLFTDPRPADPTTFAGYLITTIAFVPTSVYLAKMEPTRWGSLILGIGCLVLPVLVLRLQQIASVTGA
ncbi:hypothetical protein [Actinoplanes derwentensis]|uniref:Uncharacterized protein n=1 Tax=Actinoplanes derwentensis TaxID=113562 RepID=A0A1H2D2Y9_9ACTN|nr:hypothetical protein [Actinoplanes derwentensis]GID88295.1 hypothetical protein Ade03nite_72190 [Actinoplanes derwentensis]SDT77120.1 hypothetical protein SAMN04489716_7836 [Actinoplanes derwentensis]